MKERTLYIQLDKQITEVFLKGEEFIVDKIAIDIIEGIDFDRISNKCEIVGDSDID